MKEIKQDKKVIPLLVFTPFQLTQPLSYLNFAIRKITNSKLDHGAILYREDGIWYLSEALGKGVGVQSLENFLINNKKRNRKYYTCEIYNKPDMQLLKSLWGKHYQFNIFWRLFSFCLCQKWFGNDAKTTRFFSTEQSDNTYFCFEYLGEVFGIEKSYLLTGKAFEKHFELKQINIATLLDN